MLGKIGLSFIFLGLSGCLFTKPDFPTYEQVALANEHLKKPVPEYIQYTVKGLKSVECKDEVCTMTETDFRQNQHDKRSLLELHKLDHNRFKTLTENYNLQIDRVTINQMTAVELEKALYYKKQELQREKLSSGMAKWLERGATIILCITLVC